MNDLSFIATIATLHYLPYTTYYISNWAVTNIWGIALLSYTYNSGVDSAIYVWHIID